MTSGPKGGAAKSVRPSRRPGTNRDWRPIAEVRLRRPAVSIALRLGVDSRHQPGLVSSSDTMTRHPVPDLLPGTLNLLILRTLQTDPLHGWAISERIQQISEHVLQVNQGSRYPALHRLEHQGWIEAEWAVSELAGGPSTTGSHHPAAGNWPWKPASGNACPRPSGA
jgi:PadR family transcriptional regulator